MGEDCKCKYSIPEVKEQLTETNLLFSAPQVRICSYIRTPNEAEDEERMEQDGETRVAQVYETPMIITVKVQAATTDVVTKVKVLEALMDHLAEAPIFASVQRLTKNYITQDRDEGNSITMEE